MAIDPISNVTTALPVTPIKRVARKAKGDETRAATAEPRAAKRRGANPPGVGENLDVTV